MFKKINNYTDKTNTLSLSILKYMDTKISLLKEIKSKAENELEILSNALDSNDLPVRDTTTKLLSSLNLEETTISRLTSLVKDINKIINTYNNIFDTTKTFDENYLIEQRKKFSWEAMSLYHNSTIIFDYLNIPFEYIYPEVAHDETYSLLSKLIKNLL